MGVRTLVGGLGLLSLAACGGVGGGSGGAPEPPAPPAVIDGMTREWVFNAFDSETWDDAWRAEVARRTRSSERARRSTPPPDMAMLLGAAPRVDLEVSADVLWITRQGLVPMRITLDGEKTSFGEGDGRVDVVGMWREDAIRLEWDFGRGRMVYETWRLAETQERVVVERLVDLPGRPSVYVRFVQVYDRDRSEGGRGGD